MSSDYGIKCEAEVLPLLNSSYGGNSSNDVEDDLTDMDLAGFLDGDDKNISELTGGMNVNEWSTLFNGQLDGLDSLDPMTGIQNTIPHPLHNEPVVMGNVHPGSGPSNNGMDVWLLHETQRLERQQKLQQQKLLELQQTLLKTEILKNQLQIATISQGQSSVNSSLNTESHSGPAGYGFSPSVHSQKQHFNTPNTSRLSSSSGMSSPAMPSPPLPPPTQQVPSPLLDTKPMLAPQSPLTDEIIPEGDKRKVHNLIEKKYRCSINDRIGVLRNKVSRNCKDSKRLQKSAVLQKTIDFIDHLERTIVRLETDNKKLREALTQATGKLRLPSFNSPPATPHTLISPKSQDSEDSGHSSADDYLSDEMSREPSPNSRPVSGLTLLATQMLQRSAAPQYLMIVLLLAAFTLNPLPSSLSAHSNTHHGRTLSGLDSTEPDGDWIMFGGLWALRILLALLTFGWLTLRGTPYLSSGSTQAVAYWRLTMQAHKDMQNGEFAAARECLEKSLVVIGRPLPTSYLGLTIALMCTLLSHLLFQVMVGQWAVYLASLFLCGGSSPAGSNKKSAAVTASNISDTYHLLHQISSASANGHAAHNLYLALTALNCAETVGSPQPELYLSLALQTHSLPLVKNYYYHSFQSGSGGSSPLKWVWSPQGHAYLASGDWRSEVKLGTKLYRGEAALPLCSVSRGFCKALLCDTFDGLLLKDPSRSVLESATEAFKWTLSIAKTLNSHLLAKQELTSTQQDSGFAALQWWSSVGLVACGWLSGVEPQSYFSTIEGGSGDESAVAYTLQLAFKTCLTHKRGCSEEVLIQLASVTSNSLTVSVSELLQDNFSSTENRLHRLGLLLAIDWLLGVRLSLWERKKSQEVRTGYYQDLETLTKLVGLLPAGLSRLRMYKGCYQLLAGGNPVTVQALLGNKDYSQLRRRALVKDPGSFKTALATLTLPKTIAV